MEGVSNFFHHAFGIPQPPNYVPPPAPGTDAQSKLQIDQAAAAQRKAQGSAATLLDTSSGNLDQGESMARATLYGS